MRFGRSKPVNVTPPGSVLAAAITPRRANAIDADMAALFELLDFIGSRGVSGIVLYGSTGEFLHFSIDERARVASLAVKRSRVPVLVNVAHSTFEGTVFLAEAAAAAGAAGLLALPPYYFRYSSEDIEAFYLALAGATSKLAPLYLYNIPQFTSPIPPECSVRLLMTGLFAGIKDSSGDWSAFETMARARESRPFEILVGSDTMFGRARKAGADGAVSGIASAIPELMVAIDRAVTTDQTEKLARLESMLSEFVRRIDGLPAPIGIREAVSLRGIQPGPHAAPLGEAGLGKLFEFREWFHSWLPGVLRESKDV